MDHIWGKTLMDEVYVVRTLAPSSPKATTTAGNEDGHVSQGARFSSPRGIAIHSSGTVYVADASNHCLREISPSGNVTTLPGSYGRPVGLILDSNENLLISDWKTGAIYRRSLTSDSEGTILYKDDQANDDPTQLVETNDKNVIYASQSRHGLRTISPFGDLTDITLPTSLRRPYGLAIHPNGNLFASDQESHLIYRIKDGEQHLLAGNGRGFQDGVGTAAKFNSPTGLAVCGEYLFVSDMSNHVIRRIHIETGVVSTIAGTAGINGLQNGSGKDAKFNLPVVLAADPSGNILVSDAGNNSIRILIPLVHRAEAWPRTHFACEEMLQLMILQLCCIGRALALPEDIITVIIRKLAIIVPLAASTKASEAVS